MKLVRHAKITIGSALTMLASVGLIVGIGSVANGAIAAPAPQDHEHKTHKVELKKLNTDNDQNVEVIVIGESGSRQQDMLKKLKKKHNIEIGRLHGDQDENVEVIIIGDDDSDHKDLLKKLKTEHKIEIKKLHGDLAGDVEVVVVSDDEDHGNIEKKIHRHVVDLLHGQGSSKADYREIANQLREIADRLDGGHSSNKKHGHHEDIEIHHGGGHGVHVFKHAGSDKAEDEEIEIVTGAGKRFQIRKSDQPHEVFIEITPEGNPKVQALHDDHGKKKWIYRSQDHDKAQNIFVEKIHTDKKQKKHKKRGDATTSDENDLTTLKHLRAELDALQEELHKLRSKQPEAQKKKRVRRKKKDLSSADDKENKRLLWVAEDDNEKSGNTFVWRTGDGSVEPSNPNRFRFEFKKKESDPTESSSDEE